MGENMNDDIRLLREYAASHSEAAFAALVSRHVNLVYSVALRRLRDPHLAEEAAQAVFIILARKAGVLGDEAILPGWLCRTARYVAADTLRKRRRRQQHEHEANMESMVNEPESQTWQQVAPLLEAAMEQLGRKDHDALVLRFYKNKSFEEVGAALQTSEEAAKMRVNRALDKLRRHFVRQGVTLTAAAVAGAVTANAVQAAPAGLAATISAAAAISGTSATTAIIVMTTIQKIAVTAAMTATLGFGIYEAREIANARAEVKALQLQQAPLAEQIQQLQKERDAATNRLAGMAEELAKIDREHRELLRLRGEVGMLRENTNELARLRDEESQIRDFTTHLVQEMPTHEQAVFNKKRIETANSAKFFSLAMRQYAANNNNSYPTDFNEEFVTRLTATRADMTNWLNTFEFVPGATSAELASQFPSNIVFREKFPRQSPDGYWERTYGYADGSVWPQTSADGSFGDFERQHTIQPTR